MEDVSADGRRVSSLVPTQHLDGDPFGESKLPATLRVRDLDGLGLVNEWRASSGVRFTQPGLSRMAFSRDGAHLFFPGATQDQVHSVERGAVVWSSKAYGDSRAQFGAGFAAVSAPRMLALVDLATGGAQKIDLDCTASDSLDHIDVEQKLFARECDRGVILADWSGPKPLVTRLKGASDPAFGPDGAASVVKDDALWLRASRREAMRPAKSGESALLRKVGSVELRRTGGYLLHPDTCRVGLRPVRCDVQISPDGTRAYESEMGALAFFDPASPGAGREYVHLLAAPNDDEQPLNVKVRVQDSSLKVGVIEIPVHPPTTDAGPELTPLYTVEPHGAFPRVALSVSGLDFHDEPGRMVAQTLWAAPSGSKTPTRRLLLGKGFAIVWDAHNHVQVAGDRDMAAHSLRCVRGEGARVQLLPFSACQAQVEKTLL